VAMMAAQPGLSSSWQAPLGPDSPTYLPHTVVDEAVTAAQKFGLGKPAAGLVNAILRRFQRERAQFLCAVAEMPTARWSYPEWWIRRVRFAYPENWESILRASKTPPKLVLRVNRRLITTEQVIETFRQNGHHAASLGHDAIVVADREQPQRLPGYTEGWWSVQDLSAQSAVQRLSLRDGMRVLDACAAPGGKTAHILECADVDLLALDHDSTRLKRVSENLQRLKLLNPRVDIKTADASNAAQWYDGQPFDVILADVPCSASGVVRRHPDIPWLRRESDLAALALLQGNILDTLWSTVRRAGHLLLVTCSIFPEEGIDQAHSFLNRHPDARAVGVFEQRLPIAATSMDEGGQDGFFYALFKRESLP
jgi:16S rRNA (cytosine967-C5)-methyltransferase